MEDFRLGNIVTIHNDSNAYIILANYAERIIIGRSIDISNGDEWQYLYGSIVKNITDLKIGDTLKSKSGITKGIVVISSIVENRVTGMVTFEITDSNEVSVILKTHYEVR